MTAHLTLAENVALMAGAGTGKTHNLVTVCLHQLGGANRSGEPLACGRMWAVTFTDKAAAEMKERLRAHLLRLAAGERMPELGASYGALGRTAPPATFWAQVLADLPTANVGTFHSLCAQLLRRYAAETGIDPAFVTLEEAEARELFFRAAEQQIVADLDLGGDAAAEARRCCIAFGLYAPGAHGLGLVDLCERVHAQVREDGRDLAWLVANAGDLPSATAAFEAAREAALTAVAAARGLGGNLRVVDGAAACAAVLPVLDALRLDTFTDRRDAIDRAIGAIHLQHLDRPSREALKAARESLEGLPEAYADAAAAPLARAFAAVLARAAEAYEREKRRHAALDFTDLLGRARDLLRDHPAVRREVQARVGAIVVDEFQDTNAVQLDLMALWCERRDGAARPVPRERRAAELLPLEPAMLAVVGDRKQSIYDFRGADVAIFSELAERFRKGDGRVEHLQHNRRSVAALLLLANRLFARAMAPAEEPLPFQVSYTPKDDLVAMRTGAPAGPRAELLRLPPADDIPAGAEPVRVQKGPDERVDREADAVARRVAAMVAGDGTTVEDPSGTWRAVRGGDVAILLRRFVHLDAFRRALLANRIPHVVVHGRGFYGSQEVLDLSNLLAAVGDPGDALATAAVLRSPLVAVTDSTLLRLAVSAGRAPTFGAMLHSAWRVPENTPAEDAARLSRFLDLYRGLVREADRLGAAGVLELALDGFDYVAVISAGFQGEQRAANVAKLLARARVHDGSGAGGVGRLARELAELADREPREGQAPVLEEADPNVVRVMTVHQAKGLEFPVVFVPECGAGERPENRALLIDRDLGIAVKPRDLGERGLAGRRYREVAGRRRARERAEAVRLFYVAATRARDYLVFSGESQRGVTWRRHLDELLGEPGAPEVLRAVDASSIAAPRPPPAAVPAGVDLDPVRAERIVARAVTPPAPRPRSLVVAVTQLEEFARCPRRYLYRVLVGLDEHPRPLDDDLEAGAIDARERGTLAHDVLARIDLAAARTDRGALSRALRGLGVDPRAAGVSEVLSDVAAFVASPLGAELAALPPPRVFRELPFVHALAGNGFVLHLKGTIDLLYVDPDGVANVIDYKHTHRRGRGAEHYAFQLDAYTLAVRAFLPSQVPVRSGIVFLRDRGSAPVHRATEPEALSRFGGALVQLAQEALGAAATGRWPGHERPRCEAMGCGYVYRCHGTRPALAHLPLPAPP